MMAAVLAAALHFAASAQSSVTVYGQVDAALAHEDADVAGVASRTAIHGATHILGQGFYGTDLNAFANGRMTRPISNSVNRAAFSLSAAGSTITPPATALGADPVAYAVGLRHTF